MIQTQNAIFGCAVERLSLKQGTGNRGIRESGNPGIGESGNRGIRESGNPGIGESGNPIKKFYLFFIF
jgi:hypothetical protein